VLSLVADQLAERCVAVVRQLKGITATYRMTTKGPPSRHSHYASGILQPLSALLETATGAALGREAQQALAARVAGLVASRCGRGGGRGGGGGCAL
jgi:hypothetical protein